MRKLVRLMRWLLDGQLGISKKRMAKVICGLPRFFKDAFRFKKTFHGRLDWMPCLTDWYEEGGSARGEYFWQDLYIAKKIYEAGSQKHVDIGSRVDGFVAHVAIFRQIEVIDIRPITANIPNVLFKQADMMNMDECFEGYCDSVSCLHALEHFGLGRYGDPINPIGHELGLQNMARMLSAGGTFYLSVPVGIERVAFNGLRVFDPRTICKLANINGLTLKEFVFVGIDDVLIESPEPEKTFQQLSIHEYALGIFTFLKTK